MAGPKRLLGSLVNRTLSNYPVVAFYHHSTFRRRTCRTIIRPGTV